MAEEKIKSSTMKKTPAAKKPQKPKTATHPPYFQMIKEALMALKEKNGSSPYAIAKKIEEKHKSLLPENFRKILSLQLKNSVAKGKLVKVRASYKFSETTTRTTRQQEKKKKKKKGLKKEEEEKKTTRSSSTRSKKTMAVNKPEKKRKTKKARQPKSIKSSGSRKAMKASAA